MGPEPGKDSSPERYRAREKWDLLGFPGKERTCLGPFPEDWSPTQSSVCVCAHACMCVWGERCPQIELALEAKQPLPVVAPFLSCQSLESPQ